MPTYYDQEFITAIAKRWGLTKPHSIVRTTHNSSHAVFIINNAYVVKIYATPLEGPTVIKEVAACKELAGDLPVARVRGHSVHVNKPYVVLDKLPGEPLEFIWKDFFPKQQERMCRQLGLLLGRIHAVPITNAQRIAPHDASRLSERLAAALALIQRKQLLRDKQLAAIKQYAATHMGQLNTPHLGLRHGCFRFGNILVAREEVSGVIDWEDASTGDITEELALTLYRTIPKEYHDAFLEGYNRTFQGVGHFTKASLLYPLLYYLKFLPDIPTWTAFPGKQAYYVKETKRILKETIGEENQLYNIG